MNKNEKLKDVNCIYMFKDGDEVKAVAMRDVRNVLLEGSNLFTDYRGSGSKVVASASAKCSSDDIFDFNIGAKLAMDRLYEGYDMTPKPKRKPYNGLIYIHHYPGNCLKDNSIYRVKNGCIVNCRFGGNDPYIFNDMGEKDLSEILDTKIFGGPHYSNTIAYFVDHDQTYEDMKQALLYSASCYLERRKTSHGNM